MAGLAARPSLAQLTPPPLAPAGRDRFFTTSDGVRLHYLEAGAGNRHTVVFVPGWDMPAWIWDRQIAAFSPHYHVVALDPRSQGDSEVAATGNDPLRRGRDVAELIATVTRTPALVVGWSFGVLDTLAMVAQFGDAGIAGLVLVDNSVGEAPAPIANPQHAHARARLPARLPRAVEMRRFVEGMFRTPQPEAFIERLTSSALRTPADISHALLSFAIPRSYWKDAIYATAKPVLYIVRPGLAGQADNLAAHHPDAECVVFADAGHALFIDDADRFDALVETFIRQRVW